LRCHGGKGYSGVNCVLVAVNDTKQDVCLFHAGCVSNSLLPGCGIASATGAWKLKRCFQAQLRSVFEVWL
jgi:hypothetical protein